MNEIKTKVRSVPKWFDVLYALTAMFINIGAIIDGWAHSNLDLSQEGFFTPWHGIYYSSLGLTTFLLVGLALRNRKKRTPWKVWLPAEYRISLYGSFLVGVAGVGDLVWHTLFGIEDSIDALLSPTHLLLALGGFLIVTGPLRALWTRGEKKISAFAVVLSVVQAFLTLTFMLQFLNPNFLPWMTSSLTNSSVIGPEGAISLGIANMLVYVAVFMTLILSIARKFNFPFGSFTFLLGADAVAMAYMHPDPGYSYFVFTAILTGLLLDVVYLNMRRSIFELGILRIMGFSFPAIWAFIYVLSILVAEGTWWKIHSWAGSIVLCGIVGYGLTFLVESPSVENQ